MAFIALGSVVLTVTGAEALYADMGHFGRSPIRRAWFAIVFPALILNYMGQGALILDTPRAIDNPFFLLFPHWARIPMVLAATAATVIASQAVISGAFSVTRQAVQLGFLPRLTIRHTSHQEVGQVYVPAVNWGIFVAVVALVVGFGSSAALASAYGIAVTGTLAIDTLLFFVVVRHLWHKPLWLSVAGRDALPHRGPDLLLGQPDQGPARRLVPALDRARDLRRADDVAARPRDRDAQPHRGGGPAARVHRGDPGDWSRRSTARRATGIFLNANIETTPLALRANVEHNHTVHACVVIMSIETLRVPHVPLDERVTVDDLGYRDDGITHMTARIGFMDKIDVPATVRMAAEDVEGELDLERASYFLSRITHRADRRARDGALAQEALRRHRAQRGQPRRAVRPPRRPDRGAERAHRAVMDAPRVLILSASIGEGHDLPARVIADGLRQERPGIHVRIEDGLLAMGWPIDRAVLGRGADGVAGRRAALRRPVLALRAGGAHAAPGRLAARDAGRPRACSR